jgi:hypothetical protein
MSDAAIDVSPVSASFVPAIEPAPSRTHAWKDGASFGFHDLLDTLNPLQHIPVVSAIYRWLTGDTPGNVARIVGDGLYGGPLGLAAGAFSVAVKEETGKDPGEAVLALVTGGSGNAAETRVAAANSTPPAPAATPAADLPAPLPAAAPPTPASAAPASSTAAAALSPAVPFTADAHPPIPLFKGAPAATPARATAGAPSAAEQAFLAQNAFFQKAAQRQSLTGRTITAPIPLQLTGQALPGTARPPAPTPLPASPLPAGGQNGPIDVPQRMLDALDKYMQLQQQKPPRGGEVDLAP